MPREMIIYSIQSHGLVYQSNLIFIPPKCSQDRFGRTFLTEFQTPSFSNHFVCLGRILNSPSPSAGTDLLRGMSIQTGMR